MTDPGPECPPHPAPRCRARPCAPGDPPGSWPRLAALILTVAAVLAALGAQPASADMRGGGIVYNFTDQCQGWPIGSADMFRARYRASELYGRPPSAVTLTFSDGAMMVALWGDMNPSSQFRGGSIRYMFTGFQYQGGSQRRPLVRVVARTVTRRIDPSRDDSLANARELTLRLRIQNFDNIAGCSATVVATFRRRE